MNKTTQRAMQKHRAKAKKYKERRKSEQGQAAGAARSRTTGAEPVSRARQPHRGRTEGEDVQVAGQA